jgi:hypothetical protein
MPGGSTTSNSYTKNPPGRIGSCVMNGTPSMSLGTVRPWKCNTVGCVISLWRMIRTLSPEAIRISGPGTVPLNAIASTDTPGEVSHWSSVAVSSNTFTPFSITGSSGSLPWPSVSAGKAATPASCPSSISSVLTVPPLAPAEPVDPAAATPPCCTISEPTMPASLWPEIVQKVS